MSDETPIVENTSADAVADANTVMPVIDVSKVEISDFVVFNLMKKEGTETYLCPVDQIHCCDELQAHKNFLVYIKEYYIGNDGLFILKDHKSEEEYNAWAKENPYMAALISIMWQVEKTPMFEPPEWWPYKSGAFHTFMLRSGPTYGAFMVKLIINMELRS